MSSGKARLKALRDFQSAVEEFARNAPATTSAFEGLKGSVMRDGKLSKRTKELIAVAVATAIRCEPCMMTTMH